MSLSPENSNWRISYSVGFALFLAALLFLAGAALLEISTLWTKPRESIAGIVLILLGLPFYFYWRARMQKSVLPVIPA